MKLYLLRHGKATAKGGATVDANRTLTPGGRKCTEETLQSVRKSCQPNLIGSSPLLRALETAEIASRVLKVRELPLSLDCLRPGTTPAAVVRWLRTRETSAILLVGHMPDLAILAAYLVSGTPSGGIALKKSGLCCIEMKGKARRGAGRLEWLVTPSLLGSIPEVQRHP